MDPSFMLNAMLVNRLNSDTGIVQIIITFVALFFFKFSVENASRITLDRDWKRLLNYDYILKKFCRKNKIEYEGKILSRIDVYENRIIQSSCFSPSFCAIWKHIIKNRDENNYVHSIKECNITLKTDLEKDDADNIYIVNQTDEFLIDEEKQIYAVVRKTVDDYEDSKSNNAKATRNDKTDVIIAELFSTKSSVMCIKKFVEDLTQTYLAEIEAKRKNKKFVYSLSKMKIEEESYERWTETPFESTRNFNNLFFEGSKMVIGKVDFFLHNKDWYYEMGIPYSLGIGIYGPPGTGKTSFIKALANYTNRHIITISLKMIKTKKQLESVFFENRYNSNNKKNSIGFDKKIIVFEEIDCIGDIVKTREPGFDIKQCVKQKGNNNNISKLTADEDPLTLDDILNLWDGICETPGRIMVMTSNHYEKLDPALKRPGRIDITLEMQKSSRKIISEMYKHLFKQDIDDDALERIPEFVHSPAEIINIYINETKDPVKFCKCLEGAILEHNV